KYCISWKKIYRLYKLMQ
ncbi:hypothetical protein, partial [Plasmodium yoelii yoelii]